MVLVIAHRGASAYYPENTLKSIGNAVSMGSDIVEIDLKVTKDGQIVLMHDDTVDRTTDGKGRVGDLTLKQLSGLDAGGAERVPSLEEAMEFMGGSEAGIMFDISSSGYERRLVEVIREYDFETRSIVSGAHEPLRAIKALDQSLRIAPSFDTATDEGIMEAKDMAAPIFNCRHASVSRDIVDRAHLNGLLVIVWVVNDVKNIWRMIEMGVDGITTNCPDVLRQLVDAGLRRGPRWHFPQGHAK